MLLTPDAAPRIAEIFEEMEGKLAARAGDAGGGGATMRRSFDGRLLGQSWETPLVDVPTGPITEATVSQMIDRFHDEYERRYGNRFPLLPVEGVTYRVQLVVPADKLDYEELRPRGGDPADAEPTRTLQLRHLEDEPLEAPEYERETLVPGTRIVGPAVIREPLSTTFIGARQLAEVGRLGEIAISLC